MANARHAPRAAASPIALGESWGERAGWALLMAALWAAALALHGWRGDVRMDQAVGRWILAHGAIPHRDWWTAATYGRPFSDTEWGYAALVALWGRWGTYAASVVAVSGLAWGLSGWMTAWPRFWRGLAAINLALLCVPLMPPRPEIWSYLRWFGALAALHAYGRSGTRRGLWLMAGASAVWAQMHRSVWLVPALWGWELVAGDATRRRGLVVPWLLTIAAAMAPPAGGWRGLVFIGHVLRPGVTLAVTEWHPTTPLTLWGCAVYVVWGLAWWRLWPILRRRQRWLRDSGWLAGATAASLLAARLTPYALMGLVALLRDVSWPPSVTPRWLTGGVMALGVAAAAAPWRSAAGIGVFAPTWPTPVLAMLRAHRASNIVSPQGDSLAGDGLTPWVDGQVQMDVGQPWWPDWVATVDGRFSPAAFTARWDPRARWIVWPLSGTVWHPDGPPRPLPPPWRKVWQGPMRWLGGSQTVPTGVWTRVR